MSPDDSNSVPLPPHHTSKLWAVLTVLALALSVGLGVALWYALAAKQPVTQTALDQPAESTTEKLTATFGLASPAHKAGELIDQFAFNFTAPKVWRTIDTSRDDNNAATDALIESENEMLLELTTVPEDSSGTGNEILGISTMRLRDVSKWLLASDDESTAAQRQKAFNYIISLGNKDAEPKQMTGDTNGMIAINRGLIGGPFLRAKSIATTDGSLKGVVYLTIGTQAVDYAPRAAVAMAGTLNGKQVLFTGYFDIVDKLMRGGTLTDDAVRAKAQESFKNNEVPEDANALYQRIVAVVGNIEIKKK